jgi:hypothetical protein
VKDNKGEVVQQIVSTGNLLKVVGEALDGWKPSNMSEQRSMDQFNKYELLHISMRVNL